MEMKIVRESGIGLKAREEEGSLLCVSFVKGLHRMFISFVTVWGVEYVRRKVEMCGD